MNIIENVWHILKGCMKNRTPQPATKDQMWQILKEEWAKLGADYCESLYRSCARWVNALWCARGGYTKYQCMYKVWKKSNAPVLHNDSRNVGQTCAENGQKSQIIANFVKTSPIYFISFLFQYVYNIIMVKSCIVQKCCRS